MARAVDQTSVPAHDLLELLEEQPGVGATFRAVRQRGGEEVAVTVLDADLPRERRAQLLTSLRRLRSDVDPRISPVLTVSSRGEAAAAIMPPLQGTRLDGVLARGRLSPGSALALLAPLGAALEAAEERGVPDRDLAPRTIRVLDDGSGILTPFAFADPHRTNGGLVAYRAPELAGGAPADGRSDVYALAGLLRTAITGQAPPPWTLQTLPAAGEATALHGALAEIVWDGLADDPTQRPATPSAFLAAAAAAHASDQQTEAESAAKAPRSRRPRWVAAAAVGLFALATVLVSIAGTSPETESPAAIAALPPAAMPAPDPSAEYARELAITLDRLNERRVARRGDLREATTQRGQALAAERLGDAYGLAVRAQSSAPLTAGTAEANTGIVRAMRLVDGAYRAMSRGARTGDGGAYARGRDAVRGREALLQRRVQRLQDLGYDVR